MFIHSVVPSKTQPDSRPKWPKCIPVFRPKWHKNPIRWGGGTYLYSLYKGIPYPPPPPGLNPTKFDSSRFERTTYTCCRIVIKTSGIAFIQGGKAFISVVSDVSNNSGRPLRKNKNVLEISSNILTMKPASKLSVA